MSFAGKYFGESSFLRQYFRGWSFRTSTPSFDPGQEVVVTLTDYDDERGRVFARVGDSRLYAGDGHGESAVGKRVRFRVDSFDADEHVGEGEVLEVVGELGL
ncbi:DUF7513 family protein [Halomicrobium salinisoli]|uniref:DUF7513 family protein n=1 Tax=Halomicrobium salinisoli TaxID=2878391 RepID=UPI001CF00AC9|nr:TRAM domain-containing protein [Halomicrobium salinisoli]